MTRDKVVSDINKIEDNGNNTALEVRTVLTDLLDFSDEGIASNSTAITTINSTVSNLTSRVVTLENKVTAHDGAISTINTSITAIEGDIDIINEELKGIGRPFHFWKETPVVALNGDLLWYSFQGVFSEFVNFTFKLKIMQNEEKAGMDHYFPLDAEVVKVLSEILFHFPNMKDRLSFVVSSKNTLRAEEIPFSKIWTTTIDLVQSDKPKSVGILFNLYNYLGSDKNLLVAGDEFLPQLNFIVPNLILILILNKFDASNSTTYSQY